MKKITQNLRWLVTLLTMIVSVGAWAEDTTIATATFDGKNATYTEGWTTTGTGVGRNDCVIIGVGENITSPAFDLSGYSSVTITFKGRRYGTLSGSIATVDASIGGVSVGTIDITKTSVGTVDGSIEFTPTSSMTAVSLVFTCTNATSAGSTHGAGIGSITIIGTTSGGTVVTKTLTSIALSGTYKSVFDQGDEFSHDGMTVTATYDDGTTADVTSSATFSGYDMSSIGEQTVTVTYTEGEVSTAATYTITVYEKAPADDYATLPFEFDGGRANIESTDGLTQEGLDSDYGSSPKLKFNSTGDWVLLKFDEEPGELSFDIKGNSFSGGTFTVQTSEDGITYTDLATYTELGDTQNVEFEDLGEDVRYIKWVYTEKASGNVGLGNIKLGSNEPQIIVANTTIDVDAKENEGTIAVTYKNIDPANAEIIYFAAAGVTYDWITTEFDDNKNIVYTINANEGEARTASFAVFIENEKGRFLSESITINQAAYVAPGTDVVYTKVTSTADITDGQYLIVYEEGNVAFNGGLETLDAAGNTIGVVLNNGTIKETSETVAAEFTINVTEGSLKSASGKYIGVNSNSNGLKTSESAETYSNTFSIDDNNNAVIAANFTGSNMKLLFNNSGRFRYYSAINQTNKAIQLYKKETTPSVTIGASEWATYVAEDNVSFPPGVSAFTVETINIYSDPDKTDHVTLGRVDAVIKGTPVLVYSAPGTYQLEVVDEDACDETSNNQLKVSKGDVTGDGSIYVLAKVGEVVGFYPAGNGIAVPAGKAYLEISGSTQSVKGFLALGDFADAINNIAAETANGTIFNIAGQKVQNITKGGLYIVNGKKVFVK